MLSTNHGLRQRIIQLVYYIPYTIVLVYPICRICLTGYFEDDYLPRGFTCFYHSHVWGFNVFLPADFLLATVLIF